MLGEKDKSKLPQAQKMSVEQIISGGLWPERWRPSGRLKFEDPERIEDQPVEGVRVTTGYWYYWRSSRTKFNGYFQSPVKFSFKVRYKAHWDADDFVLQKGDQVLVHIVTWEPKRKYEWEGTITGNTARYAIIFTAAYFYYYKTIDGLSRPKQDTMLTFRLDIEVHDRYEGGTKGHYWYPFKSIEINLKHNHSSYRKSKELYGSTIHELTHSAHAENFETRYWFMPRDAEWDGMNSKVIESWARGVQLYLTTKRYSDYSVTYHNEYTGIVEDLMDTNTNFATRGKNVGSEYVSNFKISQVEDALLQSFTFDEWRENFKDANLNGFCVEWGYTWPNFTDSKCMKAITYTESSLDDLFQYWGN